MATPTNRQAGDKPGPVFTAGPYLTRQPSRWRRNVMLLVALAVAAALVWTWTGLRRQALVASAYAASTGCTCRFVSRRSLASCEGDIKGADVGPMARLVSLSDNPAARTVTAGVPLLAGQTATFDAQGGCVLEPWGD